MKRKLHNLFTAIARSSKSSAHSRGSFENETPVLPGYGEEVSGSQIGHEEAESVQKSIEDAVRESVVEGDELNPEAQERADKVVSEMSTGIEAAKIAYFAANDTQGYSSRAQSGGRDIESGASVTGFSTGIESFDVQNFSNYKEETVSFNLYATKQSDFAALFAPLLVGTPDMVDWKISIDRVVYGHYAEHAVDKNIVDSQGLRPLQAAYSDITALKNNATDLVPFYNEKDKAYFADPALVMPNLVTLDNTEFQTSALLAGKEQQLLALSQHPGRIETYTRNAQIHKNIRLESVLVKISKADGSDEEVFEFQTRTMPRSLFNSIGIGNTQESVLNFNNKNFGIGKRGVSKNASGDAVSPNFQSFIDNDRQIRLNIEANGRTKHDRGVVKVTGSAEIEGVYDESGTKLTMPAALQDLKIEVYALRVKANTTNSDLAHISLLADMVTETDICRISLRPPIVAHRPLMNGKELDNNNKLEILIEMTKVSMAADALNSFIEYYETVRDYCKLRNQDNLDEDLGDLFEPDAIAGIGRKIIRPECIEYNIDDLSAVVNSQTSAGKITDVRRYVSGILSDIVSSLIQNSRILTALPIYAPTSEVHGKIVTSPRIDNFLMIEGDPRLAGNNKFEVVSSPATALTDTFYIQLSIDNAPSGKFHPLNSGYCLYIPELVGDFPIKRGSSNVNEMAVQGQWEHVWNVPAVAKVTIKGLSEFIRQKTRLETLTEIVGTVSTEETGNTTP